MVRYEIRRIGHAWVKSNFESAGNVDSAADRVARRWTAKKASDFVEMAVRNVVVCL